MAGRAPGSKTKRKGQSFLDVGLLEENRLINERRIKPQSAFLDLMLLRRANDHAHVLAEAVSGKGKRMDIRKMVPGHIGPEERRFRISFFDPGSRKAEVIEKSVLVALPKEPERSVEEAMGSGSMRPLYLYIGAPLAKEGICLTTLERILSDRRSDSPKPEGMGAAIPIVRSRERKEAVERAERIEEAARSAALEAIIRKERLERAIAKDILVLGQVIALLRKGDDVDRAIARLPPLARMRLASAIKSRRLGRQLIIGMLIAEKRFLKAIKTRLEGFSPKNLISLAKMALTL